MTDQNFTELPVWEGVGQFHFNRFRAFFSLQGRDLPGLADRFIKRFPEYFSNPTTASVVSTHLNYHGRETLRFHGNMMQKLSFKGKPVDINDFHHDWVYKVLSTPGRGFVAQTLKRDFYDPDDDIPTAKAAALGIQVARGAAGLVLPREVTWAMAKMGQYVADQAVPYYNSYHFLAGRRSWLLGHAEEVWEGAGCPSGVGFVETAAIERFSCNPFALADLTGKLEGEIPKIWVKNLYQFLTREGLNWVTTQPTYAAGWKEMDGVRYVKHDLDLNFRSHPEVTRALRVHTHLVP